MKREDVVIGRAYPASGKPAKIDERSVTQITLDKLKAEWQEQARADERARIREVLFAELGGLGSEVQAAIERVCAAPGGKA